MRPWVCDPELHGKRALVTGASRGIGKAIAEHLVQAGVVVLGTATSAAGAAAIDQAFAAIRPAFNHAAVEHARLASRGEVLEVSDAKACEDLIGRLAGEGGLHILVNNAGITRDNLSVRLKDEEWDRVIATNLSAGFRLSRAALRPMMKARWGRIINITSVVALFGNPGQANYSAAKAGVIGLTRSSAAEFASRGVTVNAVAPGFIDSDMTKELDKEPILAAIPLGRMGTTAEVAGAVRFLAADPAAAYMTGQVLQVDGGMVMR